ncbi:MAG: hypothetical protein B7733_15730, partial [Myxococcales bacterium FL481]
MSGPGGDPADALAGRLPHTAEPFRRVHARRTPAGIRDSHHRDAHPRDRPRVKIHAIDIENINSLYGAQRVDFDRDLGQAPLFVILGPTGSGKSTILDAICLGLFGKTPRLGRSSGATPRGDDALEADDARRVMSHGTAWSRASVEFSRYVHGQPKRFRATWFCQRSRKRATGRPQPPERSMEELDPVSQTWALLVSDHREKIYRPVFDEVLAELTAEAFTRSILLAQGEFAAFLRADDTARAAMLERLTRTHLYLEIGQRAAQRHRQADATFQAATARLEGFDVPSGEAIAQLETQRSATSKRGEVLQARIRDLEQDAEVLQRAESLTTAVAQARQVLARAELEQAEHQPMLERLAAHERTAPARRCLGQRDEAVRQLDVAQGELEQYQQHQCELAELAEAQAKELATRVAELGQRRARWRELEPQLTAAFELRARWHAANDELQRVEARQGELSHVIATARAHREAAAARTAELERAIEATNETLRRRPGGEPLANSVDALRREVDLLKSLDRDALAAAELVETRHREHAAASQTAKRLEAQLARLAPDDAARPDARLAPSDAGDSPSTVSRGLQSPADQHDELEAERGRVQRVEHSLRQQRDRLMAIVSEENREHEFATQLGELHAKHPALTAQLADARHLAEQAERAWRAAMARRDAVVQEQRQLEREELAARLRSELVSGEPCPVCGSVSHPAFDALHDEKAPETAPDRLRATTLSQADDELAEAHERRERAHRVPVGLEIRLRTLEATIADARDRLAAQTAKLDQAWSRLATPPAHPENRSGAAELERVDRALRDAAREQERLGRRERELRALEQATHRAAEARQQAELARATAIERCRHTQAQLVEAEATRDQAEARAKGHRERVTAELNRHDTASPPHHSPTQRVASLEAAVARWRAGVQETVTLA